MGSLSTDVKGHNPAGVIIRKDLLACVSVLAYHVSLAPVPLGCIFGWSSQLKRGTVLCFVSPPYTLAKRRGIMEYSRAIVNRCCITSQS